MPQPIIAVVGATGAQGGGVVDALLARGKFAVRAFTRNPDSDRAKALAKRGVEVVQADLQQPETLQAAFDGAYGAFVVTNFWEEGVGAGEEEQGKAAVRAAKAAGVEHFIWSTLPNCKAISGGDLAVEHFTSKAGVDDAVAAAGFESYTFVEPPFYFSNLTGVMAPQPMEGGAKGWAVPIDPAKRCIHAGDVSEFGKLVAAAFEQPGRVGKGGRLAMAAETLSWKDMVERLNAQGHELSVVQVPAEAYDGFFPGAAEFREMFQWFERYTYFGPDAEEKIALANEICTNGFTAFADWAQEHMPA
jgi:uncharacterized protein YbjT (DUF2867 family)